MADVIDYRKLLRKYMQHLGQVEGSTFLHWIGGYMSDVEFTPEEVAELERIDKEIDDE